ncbi:MAG: radical SAM family heme chaperone HemW [Epsilonproteobacteria bacterium]|nr:radical SAM family heme chaperone HemW [Campylobacterota bacterium]
MLLYIHIPFCDSKCHYCSFNSYVDKFDLRQNYMLALAQQLKFELHNFGVNRGEIESLFIGGGTPSTVAPILYEPIFSMITPLLKDGAEVTTEANPNSATNSWLKGMFNLGVNRVSFGVQSFQKEKLKALNRAHSPSDAIEAINRAKEIGFEHISLDLIYNYQGDTQELLGKDIKQAFQLPINHISAYELTIESQTKFYNTPEVKQEDENLAFFVADEITKHGFKQYEISNFGTYESSHNQGYWQLKDYIGVGAGAVGFKKDRRYYPTTSIDNYINDPLEIREELITQEELLTERIFLGLRSSIGIDRKFLTPEIQQRCDFLVKEEKLIKENNLYKNRNFFISDEIALYILG